MLSTPLSINLSAFFPRMSGMDQKDSQSSDNFSCPQYQQMKNLILILPKKHYDGELFLESSKRLHQFRSSVCSCVSQISSPIQTHFIALSAGQFLSGVNMPPFIIVWTGARYSQAVLCTLHCNALTDSC